MAQEFQVPSTIPPAQNNPQDNQPQAQMDSLSPQETLGEGFLRDIPEQDRNIVQKYIRDWDGNVTRKFQSIHEQYQPYKELGEYEELRQAMALNQYLQNNPVDFYNHLQETLDEMREQGLLVTEEPEEQFIPGVRSVEDGEPDRLSAIEQQMQQFLEWQQEQASAAEEAEQIQELDNLMEQMHTVYGDFDDDWVLLQLSRGATPEQAIEGWTSLLQSKVSSFQRKPIPNVMGGNGAIPGSQADIGKMSRDERIAFITQSIQAAQS